MQKVKLTDEQKLKLLQEKIKLKTEKNIYLVGKYLLKHDIEQFNKVLKLSNSKNEKKGENK